MAHLAVSDQIIGQERHMTSVKLADAKAHLSALVADVEAGATVEITRHGRPVARLVAAGQAKRPVDLAALQALTLSMPTQSQGAETFVRSMRDGDRY
jgi:prevent-host-death family protein